MMKLKYLILVVFCGATFGLSAQDFHNSYYQFAPMMINPALTGAFYGNLRANVIGRNQGRPVAGSGNEFNDISVTLDGNIDFGFTEGDWISLGGNFAKSPGAGGADFFRQFSGLGGAYHLAYGKRKDKVFSVGFKYGTYSTGFTNPDGANTPFELTGGMGDQDKQQLFGSGQGPDRPTKEKGDYMVGFMLTTPMGKKSDLRLGISSDHILAPRLALSRDSMPVGVAPQAERLERRINVFAFYYTSLSDKLTFNPNILFQRKGVSNNLVIQGLFSYMYNQEKEIAIRGGLGMRLVNSFDIPVYLGVDYKSWRIGLAYDANIGGLRPSDQTFGALELGISKIFSWVKKPVVEPEFICPRL